jgi:hypothetical protein
MIRTSEYISLLYNLKKYKDLLDPGKLSITTV